MRTVRTAVVGVALLALTGCSGDVDAVPDASPGDAVTEPDVSASPPGDAAATEDPTPTEEPMAGAATVGVATTSVGEVLVDADGMTLYMFDPDEETGASTCYDDCAVAWPPLLVEDGEPTVGAGLDESMVGTVERTDGTVQVTYGDWPLYLWQDDAAPGDATGQAVNDVWWVLGPDGEPIRTAP